jgi:hypothetical protein
LPTDFQALSFTSPPTAAFLLRSCSTKTLQLNNKALQKQKMPAAVELTQAFIDQAFG